MNTTIFTVAVILLGAILAVTGCGEGMEMAKDIIGPQTEPDPAMVSDIKQPVEPEEQTDGSDTPGNEQESEQPTPTITIETVTNEEDGLIIVTGTSTDLPEATMVTITLGDDIVTAATDEMGMWSATVPTAEIAALPTAIVTVTAKVQGVKKASFEYTPPTITIETVTNEEDGLIIVTGTSTDLPEATMVTITLGDDIVTAATDEMGMWSATVPTAEIAALPTAIVTVTAKVQGVKKASFEYTPPIEPEARVGNTLPQGYELPAHLIPDEPTILSETERSLMEAQQSVGYDAIALKPRNTGSPADIISLLPHKDREEVYDLFVASVRLPHFAEAAATMKEYDVKIVLLSVKDSWDQYDAHVAEISEKQGIHHDGNLRILGDIFFEENPELNQEGRDMYERSNYWIILEYYRLQLEHPDLPNFRDTYNKPATDYLPKELLNLFRQSARRGNIFGLDSPWS